jgi:hypothetical protein
MTTITAYVNIKRRAIKAGTFAAALLGFMAFSVPACQANPTAPGAAAQPTAEQVAAAQTFINTVTPELGTLTALESDPLVNPQNIKPVGRALMTLNKLNAATTGAPSTMTKVAHPPLPAGQSYRSLQPSETAAVQTAQNALKAYYIANPSKHGHKRAKKVVGAAAAAGSRGQHRQQGQHP